MKLEKLVSKLIRASLDNDSREVRATSLRILRRVKDSDPEVADEIASALANHSVGARAQRSLGIRPTPHDTETLQELALVENFYDLESPIFSEKIASQLDNFIRERQESEKLIRVGLTPPSSLLLHGPPGVGKTQIAKYLSSEFGLSLVTLDLSSTISSYLGKTGQNLKKVLDYVKKQPAILLLDEFDAVAKRRDDMSDLGELKRIVNVLLKELEDWPPQTILIAATNHPQLLDSAIWRRFDKDIEISFPGYNERLKMFNQEFSGIDGKIANYMPLLAETTEGFSGADIYKLGERTKRRVVLNEVDYLEAAIQELLQFRNENSVEFNKKFSRLAHKEFGVPIRTIANWIGKSSSAVQYYLKKKEDD